MVRQNSISRCYNGGMGELRLVTTVINLLGMAAALWLGLYIVTRSLYSLLSWLAALTLWVLASFFLTNALLNNIPANLYTAWMHHLVVFVLPLMLHLTYLLLPDPLRFRQLTRLARINRVAIPVAYLVAAFLFVGGALPTTPSIGLFPAIRGTNPEPGTIGLMSPSTPPLFPLFVIYLVLVSALALYNLWRAREHMRRTTLAHPFTTIFLAVAIAGVGGIYVALGTMLHADLPTVPSDILLVTGVILVGVAVARYSALLEGRPLERDFIYSLTLTGSLTTLYTLVVLILYLSGQVSFVMLALTLVGTVAANALFDALRLTLDRLFYRRQFQQMRLNLRELAHEAGAAASVGERLQAILDSTCRMMRIQQAFIALAQENQFIVQATRGAIPTGQVLPADALGARESIGIVHANRKGLTGFKLLIPLCAGETQMGALVLGSQETRQNFSDADLDLLEDLGDQIAGLVYGIHQHEQNARELNAMVEHFREKERALELQVQQMLVASELQPAVVPLALEGADKQAWDEERLLPLVEDGLRHLHDSAFLGEHELAQLSVVNERIRARPGETVTFIDRGKAVAAVLEEALEKLRPEGSPPARTEVAPREWHLYTILHASYVEDEPNREIMARLYISEGTFNRTRRRALRALAKAVGEMEEKASEGREARGEG